MSDVVITRSQGVDVPHELWLEILSSSPTYFDCVRYSRVCKGFQSTIKSRRFDGPLFRLAPSDTLPKPGDKFTLHPILDAIPTLYTDPKDVELWGDNNRSYKVRRLKGMNDLATSPGVNAISLRFGHIPGLKISNPRGVTVKQTVNAFCKIWGAAPYGFEDECTSWIEALGDRNGFTGFDPLKVRQDGAVVLGANPDHFDS